MPDVLTAEEVSAILPDSGPWREEYIVALARSHEQLREEVEAVERMGRSYNDLWRQAVRERDEARAALAERGDSAPMGSSNRGMPASRVDSATPRSANADPAAAAIDALRLADELAERYGAYWRKDSAYYAYIDARAAVDAYETETGTWDAWFVEHTGRVQDMVGVSGVDERVETVRAALRPGCVAVKVGAATDPCGICHWCRAVSALSSLAAAVASAEQRADEARPIETLDESALRTIQAQAARVAALEAVVAGLEQRADEAEKAFKAENRMLARVTREKQAAEKALRTVSDWVRYGIGSESEAAEAMDSILAAAVVSAEPTEPCPSCKPGGTGHIHFDRTLCACGSMHHYCDVCGLQTEPCAAVSSAENKENT